jgi:formylglycine-generating enzyme required for sulfatase activity
MHAVRASRFFAFVALFGALFGVAHSQRPPGGKPSLAPQARVALVIGNNRYATLSLDNPVNDARLIADRLRGVGFKVTEAEDVGLPQMAKTLADFAQQVPANAVVFFYYAGHGMQLNGTNYLIPVDYHGAKDAAALAESTMTLDQVISAFNAKAGLSIVVLDACRDTAGLKFPDTARRGLAATRTTNGGTYVVYSTAPGETASDGTGRNSPFALALAENLQLRPSRLEDTFIRTRVQVNHATNSSQMPWVSESLLTVFYFRPDDLSGSVTGAENQVAFQLGMRPAPPSGAGRLLSFPVVVPVLNDHGTRTNTLNGNISYYAERAGGVELDLVAIPGGRFAMGAGGAEVNAAYLDAQRNDDDDGLNSVAAEMPQHLVKLPPFFMSKFEITQAQWQAVMGELPEDLPADFRGANLPVVNVDWHQANEFCERLSQQTGRTYRLPTEAEWEYSARAGTSTPYAFGNSITSSLTNFMGSVPFGAAPRGTDRNAPLAVGQLGAANAFGLYDMHGNVWEWCADNWHDNYNGAPTDGSAWEGTDSSDDEADRVVRGGGFSSPANSCRSAYRWKQPGIKDYGSSSIGFRIVSR